MFLKYIPVLLLAIWLMPVKADAGSLEGLTNTLENLADVSRSADQTNEAMRNALRGYPNRYSHHYADDDDYDRFQRERAWRKHHRWEDRAGHRPHFPKHRRHRGGFPW